MSKILCKIICINLCIILTACSSSKSEVENKELKKVKALSVKNAKNELNAKWHLSKMQEKNLHVKTFRKVELGFDLAKSSFNGNDGCNLIFGSLKLNKERMEFKDIASTRMACENMEFSLQYTKLLEKVRYFEQTNQSLKLLDENKKELFEFTK